VDEFVLEDFLKDPHIEVAELVPLHIAPIYGCTKVVLANLG